uniref:Uncharacterized protein n=1 Tax=Musca domestica TaxID=7370 RepID=T1PJU2_MUSDO
MPGPVDMRTYNLAFEPQHSSASQEAYNKNLLGAFDSGTADQTLSEFDEEDEREFQSALRATGTTTSMNTQKPAPITTPASTANTVPVTASNSSLLTGNNSMDSNSLKATGGATITGNVSTAALSLIANTTYTETLQTSAICATSSSSVVATAVGVGSGLELSSGSVNTTTSNLTSTTTTTICSAELVNDLQTSMETTSEDVSIDSDTTLTTKASLSDAKNQLKLKIKGPLAYPDMYNSSSTLTHSSTAAQASMSNVQSMVSATTVISASVSGSGTNSRRMRKKELLSLYVVQKDNNGDDSSCGLPPTDSSLMSNSMEVTRKTDSVCSEVDEYGSEAAGGMTTTATSSKRFKKTSSRELRSLDSMAGEGDLNSLGLSSGVDGRRRSACSSGSTENSGKSGAAGSAGKRRGRSKTVEGADEEPAPKLKIKIRGLGGGDGNVSATATVGSCETSFNSHEVSRRSVACPPKKRLTSNYTPTLEALMRDSMNYRDQVMQEFGGDEEERSRRSASNVGALKSYAEVSPPPPAKKAKSSKPKKDKKEKKRHKNRGDTDDNASLIFGGGLNSNSMTTTLIEQPISASPGDPPKLILRINKRKAESTATDTSLSSPATGLNAGVQSGAANPVDEPPAAPIRLKLARVADGGVYVIGDKKRKKGKKNISPASTEELTTTNTNSNTSSAMHQPMSSSSHTTLVVPHTNTSTDFAKFAEDANASASMNSPHVATYSHYSNEPPASSLMLRAESDVAKDSSTPSPCLVIDSSNTASSMHDPNGPNMDANRSPVITPTPIHQGSILAAAGGGGGGHCNDNSNSQSSSALSSHTHLSHSNSNSMMSNTAGGQTLQQHQHHHSNNNSNSNNSGGSSSGGGGGGGNSSNGGGSGIISLPKDCEVR